MRTSARMTGAVAAAAVVALLVSGCGSGDDGDGGEEDKKPATPTAKPDPTAEDTAKEDEAAAGPAGVWSASTGGEKLVLTVVGDAASLLYGKDLCSGRLMDAGDNRSLVLKCPGGVGEERTNGTVDEVTAKTMKVTWNGGDTDIYRKISKAPAQLPKDVGDLDKLPDLADKLP